MKSLQSSLGNIETVEVDEICVKHGIKLYQISKKMSVTIGQDENGQPIKEMRLVPPFCPQCQIEQK